MEEQGLPRLAPLAVRVDYPNPQRDREVLRPRRDARGEVREGADRPGGQGALDGRGLLARDPDRGEARLRRLDPYPVFGHEAVRPGPRCRYAARDVEGGSLERIERLEPLRAAELRFRGNGAGADAIHRRLRVAPPVAEVLIPPELARVVPRG